MKLELSSDDLRPLVQAIVAETIACLDGHAQELGDGRLAYPEPEAARLCGLPRHVLRDQRLKGRLRGRQVGKRVVIEREELLRFLRGDGEHP